MYNIGTDRYETDLLDLAKAVVRLSKTHAQITKITYPKEYPADEPTRRCPDIRKMKRDLGYIPQIDLEAGLMRMIAWYTETYGPRDP